MFHTTQGYQYILTDTDGKILKVLRGNGCPGAWRLMTCIRGAYRIYEADEYTQVQTGGRIDRSG